MTGWRIIFMGTPDFACPTLQRLIDAKEDIVAVYTQPDRPKGRGQKMQQPPVKELAAGHGIPVYQPPKVRTPEVIEQIRSLKPDIIVVVAFGQILPSSLLEIPPHGCINVHASLLPRYRGAAPLNWCIVNGETETGVTTMLMDAGLDTGPMLMKKRAAIGPDETVASLHDRMSLLGAELLAETMVALKSGIIKPEPQNDEESTYAPMLKKEHGTIDWTMPAARIHNQVRGLSSWPGTVASIAGEQLKIHGTMLSDGSGDPGCIISAGKRGIEVACGSGSILITELQAAGGRRMEASSFLAGRQLFTGSYFDRTAI